MKRQMKRHSMLVTAGLIAMTLLGACKESDCDPAKETCGGPVGPGVGSVTNFALNLATAPSNMGALLFEVSSAQRINVSVSAQGRLVRVSSRDAEEKVWRVLVIGGPKSGPIGTVGASGAGVATPTVTVVEVAADESGQYVPIAASAVRVGVTKSN